MLNYYRLCIYNSFKNNAILVNGMSYTVNNSTKDKDYLKVVYVMNTETELIKNERKA